MDQAGVVIIQKICNSIGLILDVIGAVLVAIEVTHRFDGVKHQSGSGTVMNVESVGGLVSITAPRRIKETEEYIKYQLDNYFKMKCGLICLVVGFFFQITSNWIDKLF